MDFSSRHCISRHPLSCPSHGYTLLELMITVAIAAVLAAIAYPSMQDLLASQRVRAASSALYESLITARGEAVKRNSTVSFVSADLAGGWSVQSGGVEVLAQAPHPGVTFTPSAPGIQVNARGRVTSDAVVEIAATETATVMCVQALTTGRISEQKGECP